VIADPVRLDDARGVLAEAEAALIDALFDEITRWLRTGVAVLDGDPAAPPREPRASRDAVSATREVRRRPGRPSTRSPPRAHVEA